MRLVGLVRGTGDRPRRLTFDDVRGKRHRAPGLHVGPVQLVLDLSRAPPRGGQLPERPRVPARRRRPHPQPRGRPGDEHRHRRRGEPGLEAGRGAERRAAADSLLDSYEPERIAFARRLVATTDRGVHARDAAGRYRPVRSHPAGSHRGAPRCVPAGGSVRRFLFRTVSQIVVELSTTAR